MLKNLLLERQSLVINGSNAANKTFNGSFQVSV